MTDRASRHDRHRDSIETNKPNTPLRPAIKTFRPVDFATQRSKQVFGEVQASNGRQAVHKDADVIFYPSFCYSASSTYFVWVKLSAYDVHYRLKSRKGFEARNVLFFLNHPIQFVSVIGIVVRIETYERRTIFTLDDSSSATIDVVISTKGQQPPLTRARQSDSSRRNDNSGEAVELLGPDTVVDVGTIVRVKGNITTFRLRRQLTVLRPLTVLRTTSEELEHIAAQTNFIASVLSKPWVLSDEEQSSCRLAAEAEKMHERRKEEKREIRDGWERRAEERDARKLREKWDDEERLRAARASQAREEGEKMMLTLEQRKRKLEDT